MNKELSKGKWLITVAFVSALLLQMLINMVTGPSAHWWTKVLTILLLGAVAVFTLWWKWKGLEEEANRKDEELKRKGTNPLHVKLTTRLSGQLEFVNKFHDDGAYFKLLLAHFRARTEAAKFERISKSHSNEWTLRALDMWDYFIYVFKAIFRELGRDDEYQTLSMIDFWAKDKPSGSVPADRGDVDYDPRNLLAVNYARCHDGGTRSRRVILVNADKVRRGAADRNAPDRMYFENFKDVVKRFKDVPEDRRFVNYFLLETDEVYEALTKVDIPFALVSNGTFADEKLIIRTYIPDVHAEEAETWRSGRIAKVGFHIASEKDRDWRTMQEKFDELFTSDAKLTPSELWHQILSGDYDPPS